MVCFSTVGFALSVVVVLEFYSACWAVCDAHGLGPCEYLFSELFVFSGACSAHRSFSSCSPLIVLVLGGGASQRQRDERLHRPNTTLSVLSSFSPRLSFSFFLFWYGVCRVVRAQPCEHARNTTRALVFCVCLLNGVCCFCHHTMFVAPTTCRSLLTITMFTIEHCVPLITS